MKKPIGALFLFLVLTSSALAQLFVGTNAPNTGTNFSFSVPAGATNLSLIVSNTATAYSYLFLKRDGTATDTDFDFVARVKSLTNQINIELPELVVPANYNVRVSTPPTSIQHAFSLFVTNNRAALRTSFPVLKPVLLSTSGTLTNGVWHYYQVDVPTNLPGWRIVLADTGSGNPNLYVRRNQLPTTSSSDKSSTATTNDTIIFTAPEATNSTYFIGVHLPSTPVSTASYTLATETNYLTTLAWDSGATHTGTQVFTNTSATGGDYYFKVTAQNTSVGAMRVALNVTSGEADIYLRKDTFSVGLAQYTAKQSARVGSDGFVLAQGNDFNVGQDLYLLVRATPGASWTLVAGQAHVIQFGNLAPAGSGATSTNVTMGAEGWRFFRTTVPLGTLAWRLGLNGATNEIFLRKTSVPSLATSSTYDQRQAAQMLIVPSYLVGGDSYYIGVAGAPGASVDLDNRQQTITDIAFNVTTNITATSYGYLTFRIQVPVQQIAWLTAFNTTSGDGNFSVRRNSVANEWNNDAFSEVSGLANESTLLVPPTLSDGTFYVTVYGRGAFTGTFSSGNPPITDVTFAGLTTNDQPSLVGWRLFRVPDINSQLGFIGWDLLLAGQPAGTEIALRRNAVPGRWNYRNNSTTVSTSGSTDHSSTTGFLQRQDHQADIWYIGVYNPTQALNSFVLDRRTYAATNVETAVGGVTVTNQPANQFRYFRLDVPAGVLGLDLRLTNVTSGDPRLVMRRDRLPDTLTSHGSSSSSGWTASDDATWPSGYQWAPATDWTGYAQSPSGTNESGRLLAAGLGNPIEPGTYYLGVMGPSGATIPLSYSLATRFIGQTQAIQITPLSWNSGVTTVSSVPRDVAYFSFNVPSNTPSWQLRLTNFTGETSLLLQKDVIPNIGAAGTKSPYAIDGGARISKTGDEVLYLFPQTGQSNIPAGTYYAALVSEGMNASGQRIGTNGSAATLQALGTVPLTDLGLFAGPEFTHADSIPSAELKVYRFTLPAGLLGVELRLENKVGNPKMVLRQGLDIATPTDSYGNYGGQSATWSSTDLIYLPNPSNTVYTLLVQAGTVSSAYPAASFTIRLKEVTSTPVAFDGGSINVVGQPRDAWRYFAVTIPPNSMGWDLRIMNVTSGDPRLSIRRGAAPTSLSSYTTSPNTGWAATSATNWPLGYQWAPGTDITGYGSDANGTNRSGHIVTCGMGYPLEPGDYIVGVFTGTGTGNQNPMSYTLVSRGIGNGFSIPLTPLEFAGGTSNLVGMEPRDIAYFRVNVPSNTPNWRFTLTTNVGESFVAIQKDYLPNIGASDTASPTGTSGGRRVKKIGSEVYTFLPPSNQSNIVAGTYYLAVVSEGVGPTSSRAGSNTVSSTFTSVGSVTNVDLGTLSSGVNIVRADALNGGEVRAYQFTVDPSVLSMQLRLTNRVGNPKMALRAGALTPTPTDSYGQDGGSSATWSDASFIDIANPGSGLYTLVVQAGGGSGVFSNASFTILIQATGAQPLAFDGGSLSVTNHPVGTWRYYYLTVPSNAAGWDLRITNVLSGDPRLVVRREALPYSLSTLQSPSLGWGVASATSWPTGYQWAAAADWTGYANAADGTNESGHIIASGMNNPLVPGNYYIGVFNGTGPGAANPMTYTLASRGVGTNYTIPIGSLPFLGSVTGGPLSVREVDYYRVTVPSNTPSWRLRLTPTTGEVVLLVNKGTIPSVVANDSYHAPAMAAGRRMQRLGNEHYLLLPLNATYIPAGEYFVGVVGEGQNPGGTRTGTNRVSYTLTSLGPIAPQSLGAVSATDIVVNGSTEGGQPLFYNFSVPAGSAGIELSLGNGVGAPRMRLRTGNQFPQSYSSYDYGYDAGESATWESASLITIPNAPATNYSLVVQGAPASTNISFTLRIHQTPITDMNFAANLNTNGFTNVINGSLLDEQRAFYRFVIPATNNGAPVLGWKLALNSTSGSATLRVKKDSLPVDGDQLMAFTTHAVLVPPFLTNGTYYVEVKAAGGTTYTLTSTDVQLQRVPWNMPLAGQLPNTPGLTPPDFGDTGVETNGVALPGDQGVDVDEGGFHYYAVNVPEFNGGIVRVLLEAISGNPDFYLRRAALPTLSHNGTGQNGSLYDRALDSTGTEYANFVALDGRYETALPAGNWYVAVRGSGNSNARYRLKLSTGNVTDLPLHGAALNNQTVAARDFRYYRVVVPSNAPTAWNVSFSEQIGNVIMYVRDTTPPGQGTSITEFRDWTSDNKNHAAYASYDAPGNYALAVPPLRPGHVYFLGFRGVTDGTFSLTTSTNGPAIDVNGTLPFYGGALSNVTLAPFGSMTYRIEVPADARRLRITNFAAATVKAYLEQGTLPTLTSSDHWNGSGTVLLNQALTVGTGWPWLPGQTYYLTLTNTSATAQSVSSLIDGRNCANDDNDNDNLPDCWEQLYFGNLFVTGTQDSDNDGNNNLQEYQDGTNPTLASSMLARLTVITSGLGTVAVSPLPGPYPHGTVVTLTATPAANNVLGGWSGLGISGSSNQLVLNMTTNRTITATFYYDYGAPGTLRADYRFQSNLLSSVGNPPELAPLNSMWWWAETNVDGQPRTVLRWLSEHSFELTPSVPVFATNNYTIAMLFRFDEVNFWRRILDFKDGATDNGFYVHEGKLNLSPLGESPVCFTNHTWHQVVITRDTNSQVRMYVDGTLRLTVNDTAGHSVISANTLRFFKDDAGQDSDGYVARIRIWSGALSQSDVVALDRLPSSDSPTFVLSNPSMNAQNQFTFRLTGPSAPSVLIQATTDFSNWSNVTNLTEFSGNVNVIVSPTAPIRYFRALVP